MNYKQIIKERGIKQSWIAEKLDVSRAMITLVLKGERSLSPDKEAQLRLLLK